MEATDFGQCWRDLRDVILERNSHGQRDLLGVMARIEAANQRDRTAHERFLGDFADEIYDAVLNRLSTAASQPLTGVPARTPVMPAQPHRRSLTHEGEADDSPARRAERQPDEPAARARRAVAA